MKIRTLLAIAAPAIILAAWAAPARADFPLPPERTGDLYLSSFGTNQIYCFDKEGAFRFRFTGPGLDGPRGLAFNGKKELYAASQNSSEVLVFDPSGVYLRRFAAAELSGPTGIAIAPDRSIHVASFNNDRVVVFEEDETFRRSYTAAGLRGPNCAAFDAAGNIYLSSQINSSLFRLGPDGKPLGEHKGGGLSSAMGVAVWEDRVLVTGGGSSTVAIFSPSGAFQSNLTDADISVPQGIAFDEAGRLYISNFNRGDVAIFDAAGKKVKVFGHPDIRLARSLAFLPLGEDPDFIRGDFTRDGAVDISDPIAILGHLFLGDPLPGCRDAGDANDDGVLDISDPVLILGFLFLGEPPPAAPFPDPGPDPTAGDPLDCGQPAAI